MKLTLHRFDLHTRHPFTTSRGTQRYGRGRGRIGAGRPPRLRRGPADGLLRRRGGRHAGRLGGLAAADRGGPAGRSGGPLGATWPAPGRHAVGPMRAGRGGARPLGQARGAPVWKLWGLQIDRTPPSDYTIGIDAVEVMVAKLAEMPGFPVYKIKLGTPRDLDVARARSAGTRRRRSASTSTAGGPPSKRSPVRPAARGPGRRADRAAAAARGGADACACLPDRLCRCWPTKAAAASPTWTAAPACFHGINIKLAKCGGLRPRGG